MTNLIRTAISPELNEKIKRIQRLYRKKGIKVTIVQATRIIAKAPIPEPNLSIFKNGKHKKKQKRRN